MTLLHTHILIVSHVLLGRATRTSQKEPVKVATTEVKVAKKVSDDLYLDWIGHCPRKGMFSLVPVCSFLQFKIFAVYTSAHVCDVAIHIVRIWSFVPWQKTFSYDRCEIPFSNTVEFWLVSRLNSRYVRIPFKFAWTFYNHRKQHYIMQRHKQTFVHS